jgi:hypothetical protein
MRDIQEFLVGIGQAEIGKNLAELDRRWRQG